MMAAVSELLRAVFFGFFAIKIKVAQGPVENKYPK